MENYLKAFQQPEYQHIVLNHIPIIGLAAGIFVLAIALFQKSRPTSIAAYLLITMSALSIFPVAATGEKAEDRVEGLMDDTGRKWLHEHGSRADRIEWIYYVTAASALAGLLGPKIFPRLTAFWLILTGIIALLALAGGIWTASAGGKILHREFRYSEPLGNGPAKIQA